MLDQSLALKDFFRIQFVITADDCVINAAALHSILKVRIYSIPLPIGFIHNVPSRHLIVMLQDVETLTRSDVQSQQLHTGSNSFF